MGGPLTLCLVWHQHQPWYIDPESGEFALPWVRLHGVKDYLPMALLLEERPEVQATVNLVPSLLDQIDAYAEGRTDPVLSISRKPPADLSEAERLYVLDRFFLANHAHLIGPSPRFRELLAKRRLGRPAAEVHREFSDGDLLDLQVWYNLAWVHPILREREPEAARLAAKDRGFTEPEKLWLLERHLAWLREIAPAHRRLAERGQVELTTSPYYHPILPLLLNMDRAREAMPGLPLPSGWRPRPHDAAEQIGRAFERHARAFGAPPAGVWPSEGSVSPETAEALARAGARWIATDEEILARSLGTGFPRDGGGLVVEGEALYRAWSLETAAGRISLLFRDRVLSDRIGFEYQGWAAEDAAADFAARLRAISARFGADDAVCAVILDGENAWEWYPGSGLPFLRALYRTLAGEAGIRTARAGPFLAERPPARSLGRIFSGSWIHSNFAIWAGHAEDREGWARLFRTADYLDRRLGAADASPAGAAAARSAFEALLRAEGSDWFWWFGDDHSSLDDETFDLLFRRNLAQVFRAFGDPPPAFLGEPVRSTRRPALARREPQGFLRVTLDGALTHYFEWSASARFRWLDDSVAMERASEPLVREIHWGFDAETLFFRLDFSDAGESAFAGGFSGEIRLVEPPGVSLRFPGGGSRGEVEVVRAGAGALSCVGWARGSILEAACPFSALQVKPGDEVHFFVEWSVPGGGAERLPRSSALSVRIPEPEFERIQWVV